jgi:antitoxin component of MazEF toxin-antitoxin module
MTTVRLVKVGNSLYAAIPRPLLTALKLFRGDAVRLELVGKSLRLTPLEAREIGPSAPERTDRDIKRLADEDGA